jgi:cysteinyl-tRNA synthetase
MDDDFNTAQALAALFDLAREINKHESEGADASEARHLFRELAGVLGLTFKEPEGPPLEAEPFMELQKAIIAKIRKEKLDRLIDSIGVALKDYPVEDVASHINWVCDIRTLLRKNKQFQLADEIRAKLNELGIVLEDTPTGTVWRRKR